MLHLRSPENFSSKKLPATPNILATKRVEKTRYTK